MQQNKEEPKPERYVVQEEFKTPLREYITEARVATTNFYQAHILHVKEKLCSQYSEVVKVVASNPYVVRSLDYLQIPQSDAGNYLFFGLSAFFVSSFLILRRRRRVRLQRKQQQQQQQQAEQSQQ
eukprot:TRINITY_DN2172_c0_g2_i1.p1 TRINITY_DN2172_c0_g2~~TRINITY_DN2172_c0_g2_i1.p1  ORF type:complete len:143 (+),score=50.41 TRINITY_DN2172_c0_g2_i1:55-429(+)